MRKRIAVDMDEVMADVMTKYLDIYESETGVRLKKEDYWGGKIYRVNGGENLRRHLFKEGFFADLKVIPGSQEVIRELMEYYDVFITTAAMEFRAALAEKRDWLQEHFPFIHWKNMVLCGDKSIIKADYMIDDHAFNLRSFAGKGLLYTAPHNVNETDFTRVNNWEEVRQFFEQERQKVH